MKKISRRNVLAMAGLLPVSLLAGHASAAAPQEENCIFGFENKKNMLSIARQGMFSAGGTVTAPVAGTYDPTTNWLDVTRAGNTAHVDHANVLYQIPSRETGNPMVFLHGYGQSRMGWMTTPDGREGWSTSFLKKGTAFFWSISPAAVRRAVPSR